MCAKNPMQCNGAFCSIVTPSGTEGTKYKLVLVLLNTDCYKLVRLATCFTSFFVSPVVSVGTGPDRKAFCIKKNIQQLIVRLRIIWPVCTRHFGFELVVFFLHMRPCIRLVSTLCLYPMLMPVVKQQTMTRLASVIYARHSHSKC